MRTLLLLRGAPGSGKSTWVKENGLQDYTLEADKFRTLVTSPIYDLEGNVVISQDRDQLAWKMLFNCLETRMKNGDFTVIDATHNNPNMFRKYKTLKTKYRYRLYYKEFNVPLEELYKRNAEREENKRVPEKVLERANALINSTKVQTFVQPIQDISEIDNYFTEDLDASDKFNRVIVIGDVHGCYSALTEMIGTELDEKTLYVFSGNYLDKGLENKETLNFLMSISDRPNVIFIEGNHEKYMYSYCMNDWAFDEDGTVRIPKEWRENTQPQIEDGLNENEICDLKKNIEKFIRKTRVCYAFKFNGQKYFVCNGGMSAIGKIALISAQQLIHGVGNYDTPIDEIFEKSYQEGKTQGFIQLHGHRLTESTEHSICLDNEVEWGGNLLAYEITKENGGRILKVKNNKFRERIPDRPEIIRRDLDESIMTENEDTNKLLRSKLVSCKVLDDHNLMSLNFSDEAFRKKKWTEAAIKARGLFVDKTTGDVKLRSYNKFFNLYERSETTPEKLQKNLKFPLKAYKKENGFLGIYSVVDGDDILASKSTTHGDYVAYFKEVWNTLTENERKQFHEMSVKYNCSFVFEVCNVKDKHIIDFDENNLTLLDAIKNSYEMNGIDIDEEFSDEVCGQIKFTSSNIKRKILLKEFNSVQEVIEYCKSRHHDRDIEGIVLQDRRGYMFKYKMHYYTVVKRLRSILQGVKRMYHTGVKFGGMTDAREVKFGSWLARQPYEYLEKVHIIDAVKDYEKENGLIISKEN